MRSLKIPMMGLIKSKCFLSVCECSVNVFVDSLDPLELL